MHMSIQDVHVQRVSIVTTGPFEAVVARIDGAIGSSGHGCISQEFFDCAG